MRIGSRGVPDQTRPYSRASASPEDFGAGVATALRSLGGALGGYAETQAQLAEMQRNRERQRQEASVLLDFTRLQGEVAREGQELRLNAPPGAPNYTNERNEAINTRLAEFRQRHADFFSDPERAAAFDVRTETWRQGVITSDFSFELESDQTQVAHGIRTMLSEAQTHLRSNPGDVEDWLGRIREYAQVSGIAPTLWQQLEPEVMAGLAGVWLEGEMSRAATGQTPVRQPYEAQATESGAIDTARPTFLGRFGSDREPRIMIRPADGSAPLQVQVGAELGDGWIFRGVEGDGILIQNGDEMRTLEVGESLPQPTDPVRAQPVAPGMPGPHVGLLEGVASVESGYGPGVNPYNVLFGGDTFTGYHDHPRIARQSHNGTTTAAGRYQFLAGTWDFVRRSMEAEGYDFGPEPFSPVNQDRAAVWYSAHRYRLWARQRNLPPEQQDMNAQLASGDPQRIELVRQALAGQGRVTVFEGLQRMSPQQFYNFIMRGAQRGANGTAEAPSIWNNPAFASLPYETRVQLEQRGLQAATAAMQAQAAERQRAQQEVLDGLIRMSQDGSPNLLAAVEGALPQFTDVTMRGRALGLVEEARIQQTQAGEAFAAVQAGNPIPASSAESVDSLMRVNGIMPAVNERDPNAAQFIAHTFARTGQIGPDMLGTLMAMTNHGNPANQVYALELLAEMNRRSPFAFQALRNEDAQNAGRLWDQLQRQTGSPQEALERYNFMRSPEGARVRRERIEEARELLTEFTPTEMLNNVTTWLSRMFGGVTLPQGADNAIFIEHYRDAFEFSYSFTGDASSAHAFASETLRGIYHPSPLTGELQFLSPTSPVVSSIVPFRQGESGDWVQQALVAQHPQLQDAGGVRLITDNRTLEAVAAGQVPTYGIQVITAGGLYTQPLDENNQPIRYEHRPAPEQVIEHERELDLTHLRDREQRMQEQLREVQGRMTRLRWAVLPSRAHAARDQELQELEAQAAALQQQLDALRPAIQEALPTPPALTREDLENRIWMLERSPYTSSTPRQLEELRRQLEALP